MSTVTEKAADMVIIGGKPAFDGFLPNNTKVIPVATTTIVDKVEINQAEEDDASKFLGRQAIHFQQFACFSWLIRFSVLEKVPPNGSISYSTLAALCGVPEHQLRSVARMAMTASLLKEPVQNEIAHSNLSRELTTQPNLLAWAVYMTSMSAPTAAKMPEQTTKWGATTAKNETSFNLAFDTDLPFFDHTKQSPERSKQFAEYMRSVTSSRGMDVKHLLAGFDWQELGEATIVDVGGSTGHTSIALAEAFPKLSFVVQDLGSTLSNTSSESLPAHLRSRIAFQPHDFFTAQSHTTADVYLLRMILHDWPADSARQILTQLAVAMKPNARIVIMDSVLPPPGWVDKEKEALLRVRDLTMMQAFNAKEREWEEWKALVDQVKPELYIKSCKIPEDSMMAVMEIVKKGT